MGDDRPTRSPLVLWLAVSLAFHVAVLLPALYRAMQHPAPSGVMQANFEPDSIEKPDAAEQMQLGIEESVASTMTWIGYEQYEEHLAQLGEVEQAAFDRELPTPSQPDVESVAAAEPVQPDSEAIAEAASAQPDAESPEMEAAESTPAEIEVADASSAGTPQRTIPIDPMSFLAAFKDAFAVFQPTDSAQPNSSDAETDAQQQADAENAADQASNPAKVAKAAEQPPQTQSPPPSDVVPPNPVADQSDRESDPASIVEVPLQDVKLGKPLAAKGLELKPARPTFTTLQLVTLAPCCNPLTIIEFTRDGRPLLAKIAESSGHALIDEAVRASLYKWRASGEELSTLTGDQTITVEIRIILVNR